KAICTAVALAFVAGGYLAYSTVDSKTAVAVAAKKTYAGTMYVAGMGGHFAVADLTIDPNNADDPLKVNKLDMIEIGKAKTHPTHDARIDNKDKNTMYWSTYKPDPNNKLHTGKSDLKTGKVITDLVMDIPARATFTGANYCASGQSEKYFMPVSMANEGYIDVIDKKTMALKQRVFLDDLGIKAGETTFAHGINTPDMKKFLLTLNDTPTGHTKWTGGTRLIMLDMAALEQGKMKKLAEGKITGKPMDASGGTITFRQYFSADGKLLFQSGADRGYVIDAKTLKMINEVTPLPGEAHDFMPTPDAKYALLTLRQKAKDFEGKDSTDGTLQLYDVEAKKLVGKPVSVCFACHIENKIGKAILCGMDANWK
ncbi:MAG: hypothetical protein A2511_04795, partial [Deltaproteobacteria bacterium RIFOXYD12_FULL_50_9]